MRQQEAFAHDNGMEVSSRILKSRARERLDVYNGRCWLTRDNGDQSICQSTCSSRQPYYSQYRSTHSYTPRYSMPSSKCFQLLCYISSVELVVSNPLLQARFLTSSLWEGRHRGVAVERRLWGLCGEMVALKRLLRREVPVNNTAPAAMRTIAVTRSRSPAAMRRGSCKRLAM